MPRNMESTSASCSAAFDEVCDKKSLITAKRSLRSSKTAQVPPNAPAPRRWMGWNLCDNADDVPPIDQYKNNDEFRPSSEVPPI